MPFPSHWLPFDSKRSEATEKIYKPLVESDEVRTREDNN